MTEKKAAEAQDDYKKAARQAGLRSAKLGDASPEVMKNFASLAGAVLKDGAVSLKAKELISVALAVQAHCKMCIFAHVKNAIQAGVTREELVEALGVAVLMGGGPSASYSAIALEVFDQFSAK
ncbi:MAG: carboxymuconolactone decarboxylase family protein [Pyramidobacter sp.]|jgi:AhpD family alkylhydroperoxidase